MQRKNRNIRFVCTLGLGLGLSLGGALLLAGCSGGGGESTVRQDSGSSVGTVTRSNTDVRPRSGRSQRELRALAVETLLGMTSDVSPELRANALEALQGNSSSLESVAALGLSDRNAGVRSVAAMVVGREKLDELSPMLEGLTHDSSPFVRASALFGLSKVGRDEVDLTPLSAMLLDSEDIRVSSHAAFVLGELGNSSAIPLLQQAAGRSWGQTAPIQRQIFRLQVSEAMIKLGDMDSMHVVRGALYPARPEELEATALAVQIIGEVKDRGAIDQLIYLVDEESDRPMPAEVRLAIAGALAKLGLPEGGFIADEYAQDLNPVVRAQAATVYGRTGRVEHFPKLEAMLADESPQVRTAAAGGILEILGS